ncbi:hypothetical protein TELCIR_15020 [Teladorsagia circumcincta]|uniref:Uncharacterized protein n=1 Tax=Teladorsagia circumcincta TaxID=45464 RepID=A0A2G9U0Z7_TELCI|nr:hypothetical protein TELCIR_15020 [Teladorsagia circumcincta]
MSTLKIDLPYQSLLRPYRPTSTREGRRFESTGEEELCRRGLRQRSSRSRRLALRILESDRNCVTVVLLINCYILDSSFSKTITSSI